MSNCPFCSEPTWRHESTSVDGDYTQCTYIPDSDRATGRTTRSATPDGRGATSRRDRAGTIPAAEILTRFDTAYPWWAHYRGQLAALRDAQGKKPQPGRHAARDSLFFVANAEMQAAHDGLMGLGVRHG